MCQAGTRVQGITSTSPPPQSPRDDDDDAATQPPCDHRLDFEFPHNDYPLCPPPSAKSILQLYAHTLRTAKSFSSYNFREYFIHRAKSTFKEIQAGFPPLQRGSKRINFTQVERDCQSALRRLDTCC